MNLNTGDKVLVLTSYTLCPGIVLKVKRKTCDVSFPAFWGLDPHIRNVKMQNIAHENEEICVVWEQWKGVNGRGGYRIERELYNQWRIPAKTWPHQTYIYEPSYGQGYKL